MVAAYTARLRESQARSSTRVIVFDRCSSERIVTKRKSLIDMLVALEDGRATAAGRATSSLS